MTREEARARPRSVLVANPSADLYGSDRMVLEAVRGLVAGRWSVVVTVSAEGPLRNLLEEAGARVVLLAAPVVRKSHLSPRGLARLMLSVARGTGPMSQLLRELKPDVVYVNTLSIPLWLVLARVFRIPTVLHVHEAETSISPLAAHGLALPTHLATRIIYNSQTSRLAARQIGQRAARRTRVIYNGVRGPDGVPPPRREVDNPRLGYLGRLSPRKGVDVAVRAESELVRRGVSARLALAGDTFAGYEWYEAELAELVQREELESRVTFTGFVADVSSVLRDVDVVVVPSRSEESFGNIVIESAIAARPVVVSDHSGLREAAGSVRAATLVPADDPIALADAVEAVLADWPAQRRAALEDAPALRARYAPERFQHEVAEVLWEAATVSPRSARRTVGLRRRWPRKTAGLDGG